MKIEYTFADGARSIVEVEDNIGEVILESRRLEDNLDRRERYHSSYSLDGAEYEGGDFSDGDTLESLLERKKSCQRVGRALDSLSETQRRRLLMLADGLSVREIARREGISFFAAHKSIEGAKKLFSKNF